MVGGATYEEPPWTSPPSGTPRPHEWAKPDGDTVTVGITQFAVDQLTDVTHLQLPKVGTAVTAGKPFGEIESVKAVFDLYAPVTGRGGRREHRAGDGPESDQRGLLRGRVDAEDPARRRRDARPPDDEGPVRRPARVRRASVVVGVSVADGTAQVQQEYAGGRLAVLGLQLPAVVGVQSASQPPRYVSMTRLRQAMTEAKAETLARERPRAAQHVAARLARAAGVPGRRDDARGRRRAIAEQIVAVLRERGALVT